MEEEDTEEEAPPPSPSRCIQGGSLLLGLGARERFKRLVWNEQVGVTARGWGKGKGV